MRKPSRDAMTRAARRAGALAALLFAASLLGFGAALEGYSQRLHPVALLGAAGIPRAAAFDALALVVPGALAALQAWRLRSGLAQGASAAARVGLQLVLLSALAFVLQGMLPLDPRDLDALATRLHATAWMLWWIACLPGALLLAWSAWRAQPRRTMATTLHLAAAASVVGFAWPAERWLGAGVAQRLAFAAWFGWLILMPAAVDDRP